MTNSKGSTYRLETCFTDPSHLRTRFVYPDRTASFAIDGESATAAENDGAPEAAGEAEKRLAFGHNFHAIRSNFTQLLSEAKKAGEGWAGTLVYGGRATSLSGKDGRIEGFRFELPDTTPIDLHFSDWRDAGEVPYRLELKHAGVTYDYRFTKVEFAPC